MKTPLRLAREGRGKTLLDVCSDLGWYPTELSEFERGLRWPTQKRASQLLEYYPELKVADLFAPFERA